MIFRYVDRPVQFFRDQLEGQSLDKSFSPGYCWQFKGDGWCTQVIRDTTKKIAEPSWGKGKDGSLFFLSRRPKNAGGPTQIPINDKIIQAIEGLELPDQSAIAAEWMGRRTIGECPEMLYFFDLLWWEDKWQGTQRFDERMKTLSSLHRKCVKGVAELMPCGVENFDMVYDMLAKDPSYAWTEGLVIKHQASKLKGDITKGVDNGLHAKVKWRAGASGRDEV